MRLYTLFANIHRVVNSNVAFATCFKANDEEKEQEEGQIKTAVV